MTTKSKHSLAPWKLTGGLVKSADNAFICQPAGHADRVATANRKLIAAAPDLLSALEKMVADYQEDNGNACDCRHEPENKGHVCSLCLAIAAIAKATT